nr:MAG TPA: hypothetical protein [Caudoviricetes sp.]
MRVSEQKDRLAFVGGQLQGCGDVMHLADGEFQTIRCKFAGQSAWIHADFLRKFLLGHTALFQLAAQKIHVGRHEWFTSFHGSHKRESLHIE